MLKFLQQPAHLPEETGPEADQKYKKLRLQVFIGAFIGYAGFYLVRKNLSMAIPAMGWPRWASPRPSSASCWA